MKKIPILFFAITLLLAACQSSRSLLTKGEYDEAINKSVKKLRKNSSKQNEILVLDEAYQKAMDADSERIVFLKKEGRPDNWDQIFNIYSGMKIRQEKVKPLPQLKVLDKNKTFVRTVNFHFRNFDDEIIQAKQKAAEYDYALAMSLLEKGGRPNARLAFAKLEKVKRLISNYKDVDDQISRAREMGTSNVLLKVKNDTRTVIPRDLEDELLKITPDRMNDTWIRYSTKEAKGINYDFFVLISLQNIEVSPEHVKESQFTEGREIQNGWQYVKDSRGNVMKDSLGNDLKVPKMMEISCTVIETTQLKTARITASLDFMNSRNRDLLKSFPLIADSKFDNYAAVPIGDPAALSEKSKKRLGGEPKPFPRDADMIYQAGTRLKEMAKSIIVNNDEVLQ